MATYCTNIHSPSPSLPPSPSLTPSPHTQTHLSETDGVCSPPKNDLPRPMLNTHTHTHRSQLSMLRCLIVSARPKSPGQIKCARLPSQHYRTKPSHPPEIGPGMWCQSGTQHRVFFNSWPTGIVTQFSKEIGPRCSRQCYKPLCHKRKDIGVSWDKQKIKSLHWQ